MSSLWYQVSELKWRGNIYAALLERLLLAMFLFMLCRISFYFFNASYFPGISSSGFLRIFMGGIRFDFATVLYLNVVTIVLSIIPVDLRFRKGYQQIIRYNFFVFNGLGLAMNAADMVYYPFTLRRTTADIFQQFQNETNLGSLFFRFLVDYWYAFLFWLALVVLMVWLYGKIKVGARMVRNPWVYYGFGLLSIPIVAFLFIGGVRGGFAHSTRPLTLSNAGEYVRHPQEISLVLNTPFAVFRTLGKTKIQKIQYFDKDRLESYYTPLHTPTDSTAFRKHNVVIIILESFSKEFIGAFNHDKENYAGYTPFLDSLINHSLTFEYSFANGRKSIDGLPSVLASIPSLGVPYVLTPFSGNSINSLGSTLQGMGYHTSFFHGAPNGSMGFKAFMNLAGFEHYYGKDEYERDVENASDDFDGIWGIWDDRFFDYYARQLNTFPQPFVSSLFSVSSHHPFKVPEAFEEKFKGGEQPILKCIEYTDYALKKFFEQASTMPWYENTLFVITADHCSSNILFDESHTTWGLFSVPVIFFKPDNSIRGRKDELVQQIDIMPSVLGYLQYNKPYVAFGRDIFRETTKPFAFNYRDTYNLYLDDYLLVFDGKEVVSLFDYKNDKMLTGDLKAIHPEQAIRMELQIKAIIQQYNNRMVENRLLP